MKSIAYPYWLKNQLLVSQIVIGGRKADYPYYTSLWDAEYKIFSQWGEDGILDYICDVIELRKPKFLEIGVGDFSESNSRFMAYRRGASITAVDKDKSLLQSRAVNELQWRVHIQTICEEVTVGNAHEIQVQAAKFMGGIDILSLDIDSIDYWILKRLELDNIKVIVVEYNPCFGFKKRVTVPLESYKSRFHEGDSGAYYGASLSAFIYILTRQGFAFLGTNSECTNAFFVESSLGGKFPFTANPTLAQYVDCRIRDSRNSLGKKDFLSQNEYRNTLANKVLFDLEKDDEILFRLEDFF
jgi:hypothetical protein